MSWNWQVSYQNLPDVFWQPALPRQVKMPRLVVFNESLAAELGVSNLSVAEKEIFFSGTRLPEGASPIALAYAGHQFGQLTILGDGRATLLGDHRCLDGRVVDIQLKGSGPTVFSRRGDGLAALGPMLREYLISEAMAYLGIPTTRGLAVVQTGESVFRESMLPGAVLTRVASSHLRVGTFEYAAILGDVEALRSLADYAILRHYPFVLESENKYRSFLEAVISAQAKLIAKWMQVGFIHGVMNTDNMAISGETIDFGPCAFMDTFKLDQVYSSIDVNGRYAYGNQPEIALWNLTRFAETLLPLLASDLNQAKQIALTCLDGFSRQYHAAWLSGYAQKLGFESGGDEEEGLILSVLNWMQESAQDYTLTFSSLADWLMGDSPVPDSLLDWMGKWKARVLRSGRSVDEICTQLRQINQVVIPRNHLVEKVLDAAHGGDFAPFKAFCQVVSTPFLRPSDLTYCRPPDESEKIRQTFCGT